MFTRHKAHRLPFFLWVHKHYIKQAHTSIAKPSHEHGFTCIHQHQHNTQHTAITNPKPTSENPHWNNQTPNPRPKYQSQKSLIFKSPHLDPNIKSHFSISKPTKKKKGPLSWKKKKKREREENKIKGEVGTHVAAYQWRLRVVKRET